MHFCGDTDTVEVVLRTIISVNQLSVYGAVADLCVTNWPRGFLTVQKVHGDLQLRTNQRPLVAPTDLSTTTTPLLTHDPVQGDLLREHERKFANLPDDLRLIRLCSNAGIVETVARGQNFVTLDDVELAKLGDSCREYTSLQDDQLSKVKKMDPWKHEDRSSFEGISQLLSRP